MNTIELPITQSKIACNHIQQVCTSLFSTDGCYSFLLLALNSQKVKQNIHVMLFFIKLFYLACSHITLHQALIVASEEDKRTFLSTNKVLNLKVGIIPNAIYMFVSSFLHLNYHQILKIITPMLSLW
jgi:hypothetical protein